MQTPGLLILILALCCQAVFPAAPQVSPNAYKHGLAGDLSQVLYDEEFSYIYGLERLAQQANNGEYETFLPDRLGSVRQLAGASGFPSFAQEFDPYGSNTGFAGRGNSHYGFAGGWIDSTGLQYLRARYYSPAQGRFISRDPFPGLIDQPASLNPYSYALNNPVLYTDPSGEFVETIFDAAMLSYDLFTIIDNASRGCSIGLADWGALGLDALSLAVPFLPAGGLAIRFAAHADDMGDLARLINKSQDIIRAAEKMVHIREAGRTGELLAGITKNTERIESFTGKTRYRIPDVFDKDARIIQEVKNVGGRLSYTSQLKDFVIFAQREGYKFDLIIRKSTQLTKPLQEVVEEGLIRVIRRLP